MNRGIAVALAVVVGAVLGVLSQVVPGHAATASLGLAGCALLLSERRLAVPLVLAALAALSAANGARARDDSLEPPLLVWFDSRASELHRLQEPVVVVGRLVEDASRGDFGVQLRIDVVQLRDHLGWHPAAGRVQASVSGALANSHVETWTRGRPIRAMVLLRRPRVALNPGGPDARAQALRRHYALAGTIKSAALVDVERGSWWDEAAAATRRWVRDVTTRHIQPLDAQSAAIVTAILIGDRAGLDPRVVERLQRAGTYHVVAISGGNVALVTAACFFILRLVVRSGRVSAWTTIVMVLTYGWIVGGDASVTRAVTAAVVYLGIGLVGLVLRPIPVIGLVALLVGATDPLVVLDVAAWLSFGATIGIVVGVGRLQRFLNLPRLRGRGAAGRVAAAVLMVGCVTLAAELALLPVAALVFGRVGVAGLLVNIVAVPAMALVQVLGAATMLAAVVSDTLAAGAARGAHLAAAALVDSARLVDLLPGLSWRVPRAPALLAAASYGGWIVWLRGRCGAGVRRSAAAIVVGCALVFMSGPGGGKARPGPRTLRITTLDVGQGDSILVQFPGGRSMLVDAGGTGPQFDIATRVVVPAVWALGVRRLDWFVVSHADRDHVGGAVGVLRDLRPTEVWEGVPVPASPELVALRRAAWGDDIVWRSLQAGHRIEFGDVRIEVVHPAPPDWERPRVRNDDSLVVRFRTVWSRSCSPAMRRPSPEQSGDVTRSSARLRVLKVAHHGSRSSSGEGFVADYRPAVALISAGRGNLFGHPAAEVVARLERAHAEIFRTDRDGAIRLETDGRTIRVSTATGRSRFLGVFR